MIVRVMGVVIAEFVLIKDWEFFSFVGMEVSYLACLSFSVCSIRAQSHTLIQFLID